MKGLLLGLLAAPASAEIERVIVVARHGNRAPNPQVPEVCPKVMGVAEQFGLPIHSKQRASLSDVGVCENWESGNFLREQYKAELYGSKDAEYVDDGSFFAFSERMNRNVQSTESLLKGFWPDGTGEKQFLKSRPNLVPFLTSSPFHDTLINTPRDGPCKPVYKADSKAWVKEHAEEVMGENHELIYEFGKACGFDFFTSEQTLGKPFPWAIKAAADAFNMALNEGIDVGGKFDMKVVRDTISMASKVTNSVRFGKKHQVTYWLGRFVDDALLANMAAPEGAKKETLREVGISMNSKTAWAPTPQEEWDRLKVLVFLNHRELMMSLSMMFGYDQLLETPLKAGSMIVYELHKEGDERFIVTKAWNPSQPSPEEKREALKEGSGLMKLYSNGTVETLKVGACGNRERCTLQELHDRYSQWTQETGTWQDICGVATPAASDLSEAVDDDDESTSSATDAATFAMLHATEPSMVSRAGAGSSSFAMALLMLSVPLAFLGGVAYARRGAERRSDEFVAMQ